MRLLDSRLVKEPGKTGSLWRIHYSFQWPSLACKNFKICSTNWEASRRSRKGAWENLQEIRWVLKDAAGVELPPPARKTIDREGRLVKDGVRKSVKDRQIALGDLVKAIQKFRNS